MYRRKDRESGINRRIGARRQTAEEQYGDVVKIREIELLWTVWVNRQPRDHLAVSGVAPALALGLDGRHRSR